MTRFGEYPGLDPNTPGLSKEERAAAGKAKHVWMKAAKRAAIAARMAEAGSVVVGLTGLPGVGGDGGRGKVDDRGIERREPPRLKGNTVRRMTELVKETSYTVTPDGLRGVVPYYYVFVSNAKKRWCGQTIRDLFTTEFRGVSPEFIVEACAAGRLRIQGQVVSPDLVIRDGDWMTCETHRHEPPVLNIDPEIVEERDAILAVSKPCSLPVHPCGRYRHNSAIFYLARKGYPSLYPLYRLDRLTSGLLLFAKTSEDSRTYSTAIAKRFVSKVYLARVDGVFPSDDGPITLDAPLRNTDSRLGNVVVDVEEGKAATTVFELVAVSPSTGPGSPATSLVRCKPLTGRTHQIRVHLAHLGFPICNDPIYNQEYQDALDALPPAAHASTTVGPLDPDDPLFDPICEICTGKNTYTEPAGLTLELWLHAHTYTLRSRGGPLDPSHPSYDPSEDDWAFTAPPPYWASHDFGIGSAEVGILRAKHRSQSASLVTTEDQSSTTGTE